MSSDEHFSLRLSDSDSENQTHQKLRILGNAEVHNKKNANNQLASPAKREIQLNVSPQCLSKNDDAKRTPGSPQKQLSTEIFESEESEVIRLEKNLPTVTNKDYLADNVCKNISQISNVDFGKSHQLNSNSNTSKEFSEYAIFDSTKTSDSSAEFLGFKNPVQSFFPKVADNKRQVLKKTITTSSGKKLSTNRKYVPSNFESTEKEKKNLPLSSSTDSSTEFLGFQNTYSERNSKRNVRTNNNYVFSDFESVKKKNENISEISNSSQKRYIIRSTRIEESDCTSCSSGSSEKSSDSNQESLVSSEELSHSSTELLGLKKSLHTDEISCSKKNHDDKEVADNKRQVLNKTITTSSGKNLSTNRKYIPSNFESTEKEEKNLPLSSSTDSSTEFLGFQNTYSERSSKRNVHTNNNYVYSDFESVKKKNENISEINNSSQKRYILRSTQIEESDSSEKSWDSNQESLVSSEKLSHSSTELLGLKKSFHTDEISYSKKNHDDKNIPSSFSSDSLTDFLGLETTFLRRNLPTNQNNVSSDFKPIRKKLKNIPFSCTSDSSTEFSGVAKITSTPKKQILKRSRYCKPSSSDESDDSSPNDRNRFIVRIDQKNKRKKIIRSSSSSDFDDVVYKARNPSKSSSTSKKKSSSTKKNYSSSVNTAKSDVKDSKLRKLIGSSSSSDFDDVVYKARNPSKSSSTSKKKSSSTKKNYSISVNTAKSDIKVSRRRKEEKIKKLRKYFINVNIDLRRRKYFWRDCQLNVDKVLKWIKNQKNINDLIEDPRALQREIEVYLDHLELNTTSIISLNKRVTRSQSAAQRWQHFLKYGKTVKRWPF